MSVSNAGCILFFVFFFLFFLFLSFLLSVAIPGLAVSPNDGSHWRPTIHPVTRYPEALKKKKEKKEEKGGGILKYENGM